MQLLSSSAELPLSNETMRLCAKQKDWKCVAAFCAGLLLKSRLKSKAQRSSSICCMVRRLVSISINETIMELWRAVPETAACWIVSQTREHLPLYTLVQAQRM